MEIIDLSCNLNAQTAIPMSERIATLIGVIVPLVGLVVALIGLWGWGFSWTDFVLLVTMYVLTGFGITIGYHRLFTHKAFETRRPIAFVFGVLGSMAAQGPLFRWVATHRRHHQHSDQEEDPHTPHRYGGGFVGVLKGWWHAHVSWILKPRAVDLERYVRDLRKDALLRFVDKHFGLWVAAGLLIPALIGGLVSMSLWGAFLGLLWGGLVRVFLVHHVTWSINSVCHLWGDQPFSTTDKSRNNPIFGVLALGEGWHNNHHAFPESARHGLRWWQLDTSYLVIRLMALMGLARRVRVPGPRRIMSRRDTGVDLAPDSDGSGSTGER